jgi:hypothetical protein
MGDKVWADGIPFGFTLVHGSIIKALWNESVEYVVGDQATRKVFAHPDAMTGSFGFEGNSRETGRFSVVRGTTDLAFCKRIMKDDIFVKAGWPKYQKMRYPFLVDTNIFVQHIDPTGRMYPLGGVPRQYMPDKKRGSKEIK